MPSPALEATATARTMQSLQIAEEFYLIAQKCVSGQSSTTRYVIEEGLGDVAMLQGDMPKPRLLQASWYPCSDPIRKGSDRG